MSEGFHGLGVPPPSERHHLLAGAGGAATAVRLLAEHGALTQALCDRSPADFRPLPALCSARRSVLNDAFASASPVLPSLALILAPLVAPRLERVVTALRRRLARERATMPLHAITEMDSTCLRKNSRLPGRTLIEKAGPKQCLVGVQRVARFDTMENRVLRQAAERIGDRAADSLKALPTAVARTDHRRRALRRLLASCGAVLARPELEGIGAPRPGERPSNALVGDPDYRAAWRAWQLLRREEERFVDEWLALDAVWCELLVMALWTALDATPGVEALPGALVMDDTRTDWRIGRGGSRRWLAWRSGCPVVVEVRLPLDRGEPIEVHHGDERTLVPTGLLVSEGLLLDVTAQDSPSASLAGRRAVAVVESIGLGSDRGAPAFGESRNQFRDPVPGNATSVACAMDAALLLNGPNQPSRASAVASLDVGEEAHLTVTGREASWMPLVAGPHALHRKQSSLLGELLDPILLAAERAIVVPDSLGALAVNAIHRRMGRAWLVWSPVAAALAMPEPPPPGQALVVVVLTDAALDVAVLERADEGRGPFWIRSAPLGGDATGREGRRFAESDPARGGWLRMPGAPDGWVVDADGVHKVDVPNETDVAHVVLERLRRWKGKPATRLLAIGLRDEDFAVLSAALPTTHLERAAPDSLLRGAKHFLALRAGGLPTWKDRLPTLDLRVRVERDRVRVPVVPSVLVAPGEQLRFTSKKSFQLEAGADRVLLDLWQDDAPAAYAFVLSGPPLPLVEPCKVNIRLAWTHGLSGVTGSLVPVSRARFTSIPFDLAAPDDLASTSDDAEAPLEPPPLRRAPAMDAASVKTIADALESFEGEWRRTAEVDRKRAAKQAGVWDKDLRRAVGPLREALSRVSQPDAAARTVLARVADSMDWFLGLAKRKGSGDPPLLSKETRDLVARCRALTGLRTTGKFAEWLVGPNGPRPADQIARLGCIIDGQDDSTWRQLREWEVTTPTDVMEWGRAITRALHDSPALARGLSEEDARRLVGVAVDRIGRLVAVEPRQSREAVYRLANVIPWVCEVRAHGRLAPTNPEVQGLASRLEALAEGLPPEVRTWGGREAVAANDAPVAVAAAWLRGRYESLPSQVDP